MEVAPHFGPLEKADAGLSSLARGVIGSEILKIGAEVRSLKAKGIPVCNLTVGDFDPAQFPVPPDLSEGTRQALVEGQTNYPPSDGLLPLREAIVRFYARELGLEFPVESVLVASGARPLLYAAYRTLLDPGDVAVYSVPSWNNNHYVWLSGARAVEIPVHETSNFFPTPAQLAPHLHVARVLVINSPLNPTGTVISADALSEMSALVVEENRRRDATGRRPLFLIYDQVYWMLTFHGAAHVTPVGLVPEVAPYTILLDAISKSFCATGLRVGWGVMPPAMRGRMADILGHVGAWAPRAEQAATAGLLEGPQRYRPWQAAMKDGLKARLDALAEGLLSMKREGLPVDAIAPQGAIYLSARFDLAGATWRRRKLETNEQIRKLLLEEAGFAAVPFQAFGLREETGWFRLSVGSVAPAEISAALPRLRATLADAARPSR